MYIAWKTLAHVKTRETTAVNPSKRGFVIKCWIAGKEWNNNETFDPGARASSTGNSREEKLTYESPISFTRRWDVSKGKEDRCSRSPTGRFITALAVDEGLISDREGCGRTWKEREERKEKKKKKAEIPSLPSLPPFEFLKTRRHRCSVDNSRDALAYDSNDGTSISDSSTLTYRLSIYA